MARSGAGAGGGGWVQLCVLASEGAGNWGHLAVGCRATTRTLGEKQEGLEKSTRKAGPRGRGRGPLRRAAGPSRPWPGEPELGWSRAPGLAGARTPEELLLFSRGTESGAASGGLAEDPDLGKIALAVQ